MKTPPALSVIMRTKDSAWVIDRALAALFSQSRRDFELIIVDSGSRDRTLAIARGYPCRVVSIPAESYFPGAVLNDAIAGALAPIVVFQNSDVVPLGPHALHALTAPFEEAAVAATFARQVPRPEAHTWVRRDYAEAFPSSGAAPAWMPYSLPFAAMRREVWREQPFYTAAWGSEDTHWGHSARRAGRVVRYVPEAAVMHSHNYTLRQLYGRRFIEGEADAFIHDDRASLRGACARAARSVASDAGAHLAAGDLGGLLLSPLRRVVFHAAHLRGQRWGERRRTQGNRDVTVGQRAVLSRYGLATGAPARFAARGMLARDHRVGAREYARNDAPSSLVISSYSLAITDWVTADAMCASATVIFAASQSSPRRRWAQIRTSR